jgi:hypothetical protein
VRILLYENIPADLAADLPGHQVDTVCGVGWAGVGNAKLLRRASGLYDAFITMDRSIEHQQNVAKLAMLRIIVLRACSNRLIHVRPLAPLVLDALNRASPGQLRWVGV